MLPTKQLESVRRLSAEGATEATIRRTLDLKPAEWRKLMEAPAPGELSPLAQALEDGRQAIVSEALGLLISKMRDGQVGAAEKLLNRLAPQREKGDVNLGVFIKLDRAMSPVEYAKAVEVDHETD